MKKRYDSNQKKLKSQYSTCEVHSQAKNVTDSRVSTITVLICGSFFSLIPPQLSMHYFTGLICKTNMHEFRRTTF